VLVHTTTSLQNFGRIWHLIGKSRLFESDLVHHIFFFLFAFQRWLLSLLSLSALVTVT